MAKVEKISLGDIKKLIPKECFEKSLFKSLSYMILDFIILSTAFWTYSYLPLIIFWNIYGFIMWCIFVIGHDCGHSSFSNYSMINDICGHICHTILFVPYYPWQYSHWKHHIHHNHHKKDRSHHWLTQKEYDSSHRFFQWIKKNPVMPFIGLGAYLYLGYTDGSHLIPSNVLYKDEKNSKRKTRKN